MITVLVSDITELLFLTTRTCSWISC